MCNHNKEASVWKDFTLEKAKAFAISMDDSNKYKMSVNLKGG